MNLWRREIAARIAGCPSPWRHQFFFADITSIGVALGLYRLQDIFEWEFVERSSLRR